MARYSITRHDYTANRIFPSITITRRNRPATYREAYRQWYEHLSVSGGLDTARGWEGVKLLGDWLVRGAGYEHGDKVTLDDPHGGYTLTVVREA